MRKNIKTQMLNMQAQLEHIGLSLERFSKLSFNAQQFDTIGFEFKDFLADIDAQQNCNEIEWTGLPDYLQSYWIENMLYKRGALGGTFKGGILYILPYTINKGINVQGQANSIQLVSFNGESDDSSSSTKFGGDLIVSSKGGLNGNARAAILYDRIPTWSQSAQPVSRMILNSTIIEAQADILGRIKNNLRNCDKKAVFWVDSEAQRNQTMLDLREAYGTTDPFIVAVKGTAMDNEKAQTLQGDIANETQALFEAFQSLNSLRCIASGIQNGGVFEKKERKITGELEGNDSQTNLILDAKITMRKLWIEQMKTIFPEYLDILSKIDVRVKEKKQEKKQEEKTEMSDENFEMEDFENE